MLEVPAHLADETPTEPRRWRRATEAAAMLFFMLLCPLVLLVTVEWRIYRRILTPSDATLDTADALLIAWSVWSKTVLMLAPGLLVALVLLSRRRLRAAWWVVAGYSVLVCSYTAFDLYIYDTYGRHLLYLMGFLGQPEAIEFVGGLVRWIPRPLVSVILASLTIGGMIWALRTGARRVRPLGGLLRTRRGWVRAAAACAVLVVTPLAVANYAEHRLFERARAVFPVDPRPAQSRFEPQVFEDPVLAALDSRLRDLYARKFPRLTRPAPADPKAVFDSQGKPNVIVILLESFNAEEALGGAMPKLKAWGESGMAFQRHYSGSNHTEPGVFTLLYSRHPLAYHATLNDRIRPQLCETFRESGYEVGYFSGINPDWNRLDEFVNPSTFERFEFVGDRSRDELAWPQWDRAALARLVEAAQSPRAQPLFGLCFLNSSHMPYIRPPEYADHPAGRIDPASLPLDDHADDRPIHLAEYRRTLAFLDDQIATAIAALDPSRNIIIVTGDHGESVYHDGTHGHFTRHSEAQARVPLFIVGPGIPAARFDAATTHADLLPTLLHILAGHEVPIAGSTGRDLITSPPADEALLCCVRRDGYLELLALRGQDRLAFDADSHTPGLKLHGFQDTMGRPRLQHGQSNADVESWIQFFQNQIEKLNP